jgi:phosphate transport system substrate-binding protein
MVSHAGDAAMNDDFLYTLRRPPSAEFSRKLQRQLQQQAAQRAKRFSMMRTLLTVFLIGGSALAGAYMAMNGRSERRGEESSKPLVIAEEGSARRGPQTSASTPPISVFGAAASDDMGSPAGESDSSVQTQLSAGSATASGNPRAEVGAMGSGSIAGVGGSPTQRSLLQVRVITSALARPIAQTVVDAFANNWQAKPSIDIRTEEAATAFRSLCSKSAEQSFDIVVASRRMTEAELEKCRAEDGSSMLEFKIGYQAVVLANGATSVPIQLSTRMLHMGLAKQVPSAATGLIDNPYRSWDQVEPTSESRAIQVLGPAKGSPLRRVFEILVLGAGCDMHPALKALQDSDPARYEELCHSVRTDGGYQEVPQTVTMVSQNLWAEPQAIAVVDYNFYRAYRSQFSGSALAGAEPTDATLAAGTYPLAKPVYVYANSRHVNTRVFSGAQLYWEFVERAPGYLSRNGLTPVDEQERKAQYERQRLPNRSR